MIRPSNLFISQNFKTGELKITKKKLTEIYPPPNQLNFTQPISIQRLDFMSTEYQSLTKLMTSNAHSRYDFRVITKTLHRGPPIFDAFYYLHE